MVIMEYVELSILIINFINNNLIYRISECVCGAFRVFCFVIIIVVDFIISVIIDINILLFFLHNFIYFFRIYIVIFIIVIIINSLEVIL